MAEDNRRRYPRYRHRIAVQVTVGKRSEETHTADVSQQGVFVHLATAPAMRSLVRLRFMLPDGAVDAVAVVVRVVHPNSEAEAVGVGVQFITMDPQQERRWAILLAQLKAMQTTAPMVLEAPARTSTGTQIPAVVAPMPPMPVPTHAPSPLGTVPATAPRTNTGTRMPAVGGMAVAAPSPVPAPAAAGDSGIRAFTATLVFRIRPARMEEVAELFNLDMSSGAIMVDGVPPLEAGTSVRVEITHPVTGSILPLEASVFARLPQGGLAVSLAPLQDAQRQALANFLADRPAAQMPMRPMPPLPPMGPVTLPSPGVR